jgi:hypothetical protein
MCDGQQVGGYREGGDEGKLGAQWVLPNGTQGSSGTNFLGET